MKFRRNSAESLDVAAPDEAAAQKVPASGPFDVSEVEGDGIERVDLGSLLLPAFSEREVRLQVDEGTQEVMAVQIVGSDGALEVRAFAAPRNGDLWGQARAEIHAESAGKGVEVGERLGRFGPELLSQVAVDTPQGPTLIGTRLVGVNGDRWLLRGSFLGAPADQPDEASDWDDVFSAVVVRRGAHALPARDPLPITLPAQVAQSVSGTTNFSD